MGVYILNKMLLFEVVGTVCALLFVSLLIWNSQVATANEKVLDEKMKAVGYEPMINAPSHDNFRLNEPNASASEPYTNKTYYEVSWLWTKDGTHSEKIISVFPMNSSAEAMDFYLQLVHNAKVDHVTQHENTTSWFGLQHLDSGSRQPLCLYLIFKDQSCIHKDMVVYTWGWRDKALDTVFLA